LTQAPDQSQTFNETAMEDGGIVRVYQRGAAKKQQNDEAA